MSKKREHPKHDRHYQLRLRKLSARTTKLGLHIVLAVSAVVSALLIFNVGGSFWPVWMIENRRMMIAIFVFLFIFLGLMSPLIIEVSRDPRPLSGPGKNPKLNYPDLWK